VLLPGLAQAYDRGTGAPALIPGFNRFFGPGVNAPDRAEATWILTQLARWNVCPFPSNWEEVLNRVQRPDLFGEAAAALGLPAEPLRLTPVGFFGAEQLDSADPAAYVHGLQQQRPLRIEAVVLPTAPAAAT
jgi:nitrate/nitrite transport system ATP-binding protein